MLNHYHEKRPHLSPDKRLAILRNGQQKTAVGTIYRHPSHSAKANLPVAKGEKRKGVTENRDVLIGSGQHIFVL